MRRRTERRTDGIAIAIAASNTLDGRQKSNLLRGNKIQHVSLKAQH